jgi:hypothetical protein
MKYLLQIDAWLSSLPGLNRAPLLVGIVEGFVPCFVLTLITLMLTSQ